MPLVSHLLDVYLADARSQLGEFNERFVSEVAPASRPFVEEVLGAFAASLDVLSIVAEEVEGADRATTPASGEAGVVAILSDAAEIEFVSASITGVLGYRREELVGRVAFDLVHPDDLGEVRRRFAEASEDARWVGELRYRFLHRDGTWRRVVTQLQCIRHPRHPGLVAHSTVERGPA